MYVKTVGFTKEDNSFFHKFSRDVTYISKMLSSMHSHYITIISDKDTKIKLYTLKSGKPHFLRDVCGNKISRKCIVGLPKSFLVNCKLFIVSTSNRCSLKIVITEVEYIANKFNDYHPTELSVRYRSGFLPGKNLSLEESIDVKNINYFIDMNKLITSTIKVIDKYKHPPYSVVVPTLPGKRSKLIYEISCSPSSGDDSNVLVSCIETISKESYSVLLDDSKKKIERYHKGTSAIGEFILPFGCTDVGLILYSPYGFSCEIGENIDNCLATFKTFKIEFT
jgi:hypothetical protein